MLILWNKALGRVVAGIGGENNADNAREHVKNGYPNLIADWRAGNLEAHIIDDFTPYRNLRYLSIVDGKPMILTDESARAEIDTRMLAERTAKDALVAAEIKITAEMRAIAIERLKEKGETIPEAIDAEMNRIKGA